MFLAEIGTHIAREKKGFCVHVRRRRGEAKDANDAGEGGTYVVQYIESSTKEGGH